MFICCDCCVHAYAWDLIIIVNRSLSKRKIVIKNTYTEIFILFSSELSGGVRFFCCALCIESVINLFFVIQISIQKIVHKSLWS